MTETAGSTTKTPPRLRVLDGRLAVCRLGPTEAVPAWASGAGFYSVTRTAEELSVVCREENIPAEVKVESGWRALKLDGPFDLAEVGVLLSVAAPLAKAGVSIFAVSTFDTDYVLVKADQLDDAIAALRGSGHEVQIGGTATGAAFGIRLATDGDEPFLWEMLAEAAQESTVRAVAENPGTARYVEGWGRDGDLGVVAESEVGEPLGAAWVRLLRGENGGYGHVDDETPELAVAVRPEERGAGIGGRMISHLLEAARSRYRAVSLSVRADNPASRLYQRMGFEVVTVQQDQPGGRSSITMKLSFNDRRLNGGAAGGPRDASGR